MVIQGRQTPCLTNTLFQFCDHQIFLPWPVSDQYWDRTLWEESDTAHSQPSVDRARFPTRTVEHTKCHTLKLYNGESRVSVGEKGKNSGQRRTSKGSVMEGRNTILETKTKHHDHSRDLQVYVLWPALTANLWSGVVGRHWRLEQVAPFSRQP